MPTRSTDAADYQDVPRSVAVMPKAFAAASRTGRHVHPRAQRLYATAGPDRPEAIDANAVAQPIRDRPPCRGPERLPRFGVHGGNQALSGRASGVLSW